MDHAPRSSKLTLAACVLLAGGALAGACSSGSGGNDNNTGGKTSTSGGSTGTGGATTTATGGQASGGTASGGSVTSTGGAGTSTGGATTGTGGAQVVQKECVKKTKVTSSVFLDFENYDGTVLASKFAEAFGGAKPNTGDAYAGAYAFGDGSKDPTLSILAGHPPGMWGLSETVTGASKWGMGGGIWMNCADASAYKGISFWVRGSAPTGTFSFSLSTDGTDLPDAKDPAGGGVCTGTADTCKPATFDNIPVTSDWTQVKILWSDFTAGKSDTKAVVPDGTNLTGFGWSVPLMFTLDPSAKDSTGPYIPVAGDLTINLDDFAFIE